MANSHDARNASMTSQNAAYTLRKLLKDIPLQEDPETVSDVYITTVDTWQGNLYVGTSAAELLHFVSIPPAEPTEDPAWILASRQQPPFTNEQEGPEKGVRQILLLPGASKACVVCNATLTFYTLPELSPAYGGRIRQAGCAWVGGIDTLEESDEISEPVIAICLRQRLRLIRLGDEARKIRDIELAGIGAIQRRGDLACVADGTSYSLLDVVNQRKNELFSIASSSTLTQPRTNQDLAPIQPTRQQSQSLSNASPIRLGRRHERNTSLGSIRRDSPNLRAQNASPQPVRTSASPNLQRSNSSTRQISPADENTRASTPPPPTHEDEPAQALPANIGSPSPTEFLLTTGTRFTEPGVGLFVNLEGDVVRGTIEFSTYPESLVLDNGSSVEDLPQSGTEREVFVLALVRQASDGIKRAAIELQRLHDDPLEVRRSKQYLQMPSTVRPIEDDSQLLGSGLRVATSSTTLNTTEIASTLRQRRLRIPSEATLKMSVEELKRNQEEDKFAERFAAVSSQILVFTGSQVAWVVRSSIVTRLSTELEQAVQVTGESDLRIDTGRVRYVLNSIRDQEASNELEFVTLTYVRQKSALLLFGSMLGTIRRSDPINKKEQQATTRALEESALDPRVLLFLLPQLRDEIVVGSQGIWLPQGLLDTVDLLSTHVTGQKQPQEQAARNNILHEIKAYLAFWRKKKGLASVPDEAAVFKSVDAALLHTLLILDKSSPRGPATADSVRSDLNELVDNGVDGFDHAAQLLEQHKRLYVLSRLYQSRRMSAQVLNCWRRILDGEDDAGGEFVNGEAVLQRYLTKLSDRNLVIEYGSWLARRNVMLGVQVFADETSRAVFTPPEAVEILRQRAPDAVKDFLEYLVFGKNHAQYVNDLISFYLSTILSELTDPGSQATNILLQTTQTYRALSPPKPTFSDFITDNAVPAEWWSNRLRLLQLIGGSHGAASRYDVHSLRTQLEPHSNALVPEMIILNGREGKHEEAIHLLVSGLGDYDTAVRYCLLGGSSIFHPTSSTAAQRPPIPSREEQSQLFKHLLHEFLRIEDADAQLERTSELLERFGGWFEVSEVLELLPSHWTLDMVEQYFVSALRRLVEERNDTGIAKALASAQNLRTSAAIIEKLEGLAPVVVHEQTGSVDV